MAGWGDSLHTHTLINAYTQQRKILRTRLRGREIGLRSDRGWLLVIISASVSHGFSAGGRCVPGRDRTDLT